MLEEKGSGIMCLPCGSKYSKGEGFDKDITEELK